MLVLESRARYSRSALPLRQPARRSDSRHLATKLVEGEIRVSPGNTHFRCSQTSAIPIVTTGHDLTSSSRGQHFHQVLGQQPTAEGRQIGLLEEFASIFPYSRVASPGKSCEQLYHGSYDNATIRRDKL